MQLQVTTKVQLEIYNNNFIPDFQLAYDEEH
jgi:hypothetical protein